MANTVVVLGGGTGGLVAARALRRRLASEDRVVLVERDPIHRFAPSFLWVLAGTRRREQISADIRRLRRRGIEVMVGSAEGIDTAERRVATSAGSVRYDRLVVALGAALAPGLVPGLAEGAHDLYTLEGAEAAGAALARLERGRLAILVAGLPYKCPAAPHEAAFLAEALLRRRGLRDRVAIDLYTPEPLPMPTAGEEVGRAVAEMLGERGIGFHPTTQVTEIDPGGRRLQLAEGGGADYDLLIAVPPHAPPAIVGESGLAQPGGWIPVDRHTLATGAEGVYAIGDVTTIPLAEGARMLPKAGVFAHAQADVVARRIAADFTGREPGATFRGKGSCFLELGDGSAGFASGDFFAEGGPRVRLRRPGRHWHLGKVAFERYWMRRVLR